MGMSNIVVENLLIEANWKRFKYLLLLLYLGDNLTLDTPVHQIAYRPSNQKYSDVNDYFGVNGAVDGLLIKLGEHRENARHNVVGGTKLISPTKIIECLFNGGNYSVENKDERVIPVDTITPIGESPLHGVGALKSSHEGMNSTISITIPDGSINGILKTFIHYHFVSDEGAVGHVFIDELVLEKKGDARTFELKCIGDSYHDGLFTIQDGGRKMPVYVQTHGEYKDLAVMERGKGLEEPLFVREDTGKTDTPVTDTVVAYIEDTWGIGARI